MTDKKQNMSKEDKEYLNSIVSAMNANNTQNNDEQKYTDYDSIQLILHEVFENNNLESSTSLTEEELEDLENSIFLNEMYKNPLIDVLISSHLKLRRSVTKENKNLLEYLFSMANNQNQSSGIFDRFIGNRMR